MGLQLLKPEIGGDNAAIGSVFATEGHYLVRGRCLSSPPGCHSWTASYPCLEVVLGWLASLGKDSLNYKLGLKLKLFQVPRIMYLEFSSHFFDYWVRCVQA
jgi:hypothetical protein